VCADASNGQDLLLLLPLANVHKITGFSLRAMNSAHLAGSFPAIRFQGRWYAHRGFVNRILAAALSGDVTTVEDLGRDWIAAHPRMAAA
jgi:hypothetical protein